MKSWLLILVISTLITGCSGSISYKSKVELPNLIYKTEDTISKLEARLRRLEQELEALKTPLVDGVYRGSEFKKSAIISMIEDTKIELELAKTKLKELKSEQN